MGGLAESDYVSFFEAALQCWCLNQVRLVFALFDWVSKVVFGRRQWSEDIVNIFDLLRLRCQDNSGA